MCSLYVAPKPSELVTAALIEHVLRPVDAPTLMQRYFKVICPLFVAPPLTGLSFSVLPQFANSEVYNKNAQMLHHRLKNAFVQR